MLDRLLSAVVRVWFARPDADAPGWDRAEGALVVGNALRPIHDDPPVNGRSPNRPPRPRVSRTAFAPLHRARGRAAHGLATDWRLSLAADLLLEPDARIGSVAYQVGSTTPYALGTAFKRARGVSPRQHRLAAAATWPTPTRPPASASPPQCCATP